MHCNNAVRFLNEQGVLQQKVWLTHMINEKALIQLHEGTEATQKHIEELWLLQPYLSLGTSCKVRMFSKVLLVVYAYHVTYIN